MSMGSPPWRRARGHMGMAVRVVKPGAVQVPGPASQEATLWTRRVIMVRAPMPSPHACLCFFSIFCAAASVRAQGAAPSSLTPAGSAQSQGQVSHGALSATLGVLNPHLGGSPLWLWLEATGPGEIRVLDPQDRVLWRSGVKTFDGQGQRVVVPRPSGLVLRVEASEGDGPGTVRDISLAHARLSQLSLPILMVGGAQTAQLATRMRARAPERVIHLIAPDLLPTSPAEYLGMSAVVLGADAQIPEAQGMALRLFHCARGGVVSLSQQPLSAHGDCPDPPVLVGAAGLPSADQLLKSLRQFQVVLGLLEERGPRDLFQNSLGDLDAAGALLARRPPVRLAMGLMLITLLAMGAVAFFFARRASPRQAIVLLALTPLIAAAAMLSMSWWSGSASELISLTTVDVRSGAHVALFRTVQTFPGRRALDPSLQTPTAWISVVDVSADARKRGSLLPNAVEVWDAVDVPQPLSVIPDAADPSTWQMRVVGQGSARAFDCSQGQKEMAVPEPARSHGAYLLEKCATVQGAVAPLQKDWMPAIAHLAEGAGHSAWVYLLSTKEQP